MTDNTAEKKKPQTLLEKRQLGTARGMIKRKNAALAFIALHTQKLEDKLAPYRAEVELTTRMVQELKQANPELDFGDIETTPPAPGEASQDSSQISEE